MTAEADLQAAEYVLGTLSPAERAVFEHALAGDAAARRAVGEWQNRLLPLLAAVADVPPSAALWDKIEVAVRAMGTATGPGAVVDLAGLARLRRARTFWRNGAVGAGLIAAGLAGFVIDHDLLGRDLLGAAPPQKSFIAVVNRGGDQPALIIRVDLASKSVYVRPVAAEVPAGHSLELWYIGNGKAPKSMGLVDKTPVERALPQGASIEKADFAVTVEPKGGSPTGGPTGPIVYSGHLIAD